MTEKEQQSCRQNFFAHTFFFGSGIFYFFDLIFARVIPSHHILDYILSHASPVLPIGDSTTPHLESSGSIRYRIDVTACNPNPARLAPYLAVAAPAALVRLDGGRERGPAD